VTSLSHKIRLYPNKEALTYLAKSAGTSRFAYNWALARWKEKYLAGEKTSAYGLDKEFNSRKGPDFPWTYEVSKWVTQKSIQDLGDSFKRFFKNLSRYPRFKKKGVSHDSFYINSDQLKVSGKYLKLPKLQGYIKMAQTIRFKEGEVKFAVISRDSAGDWYASFSIEISEDSYIYPNKCENQAIVGVDLGIKTLATCSDGTKFENPKPLARAQRKLRRSQRSLARRVKGSLNRVKAKILVARIHRRVTRIRLDSIHKMTSWLVKTFRFIGIEDLNVRGMIRNHKLARALADASFGEIRRQIEYKAKLSGSSVVIADRFYPSSKRCSNCGEKIERLDLSEREWSCPSCGVIHDRDENASINLKLVAEGYSETLNACGETVRPMPRHKAGHRRVSLKQESVHLMEEVLS
jgi:putative transposase